MATLWGGTGSDPVVRASRSTATTWSTEGRFSTHCPVRRMLAGVLERAPNPRTQFQPSHQAEDMGARFALPSSLVDETRTTGVPKYRMAGSLVTCMGRSPCPRL